MQVWVADTLPSPGKVFTRPALLRSACPRCVLVSAAPRPAAASCCSLTGSAACPVLSSGPPVLALGLYFFHRFDCFRYASFRVFHIPLFFVLGVRTLLGVHPCFLRGVCGPQAWEAPRGGASHLCGPISGFPVPAKFLCFEF